MTKLLQQEAKRLNAEALVVLDGMNKSINTGTLSSSTRGFKNIEVRVTALKQPIHSGLACLAPDPGMALSGLINSLRDPTQIPGFMDNRLQLNKEERALLREGSDSLETYAEKVGALGGSNTLRGDPSLSISERIVETPSISVINMASGKPNGGNSIQESACCTLNIRVLPGQDPDKIGQSVVDYLHRQHPMYCNLPVTTKQSEGNWAWKADLSRPYSKKYLNALGQHFPEVCGLPIGGTLPLFKEFEDAFPNMEMLLPGVEDPDTAAHSHNESQDISVLRNSINSLISFLELAGQTV